VNEKPVVLAVDDEEKIRRLLKAYLDRSGYETLVAGGGAEALSLIEARSPDLVLLDLMLPDMSGESVCRNIREHSPAVPVIMLTAKADEESIIRGLASGADDYITKPFSPRQVVARVQAALRRRSFLSSEKIKTVYITAGDLELDSGRRYVTKGGTPLALTAEEYQILALFMTHGAKIFTRDEIIERIKGDDYDGFDRTIDAQIKNLRKKIGDDPKNPRYIQTVYGLGYRFIGDAHD
jgi:DNA-binding response OmpR family regulator